MGRKPKNVEKEPTAPSRKSAKGGNGTRGRKPKHPYKIDLKKGVVSFREFEGDLPKKITETLSRYGYFEEERGVWRDGSSPGDCSLDEYLPTLAPMVNFNLVFENKGTRKPKIVCGAEIADDFLGEGSTCMEALRKAYKKWNAAGRPVNGDFMETALHESVIDTGWGAVAKGS